MRSAMLVFVVGGLVLQGCGDGGSWFDDPFWQDTDIVVADVDGDGQDDILTLGSWVEHGDHVLGRLAVYRQTSPGVFAPPETCAADVYPWSVSIGDLDGNRFLDAVVTFPAEGAITVRRQDPDHAGAFLPERRIALAGSPYDAAIADLNDDARGDIAVGNNSGVGGIFLLMQDPVVTGEFSAPLLVATGRNVEFIAAGDLNGDLRADLVFDASVYDAGTGVVQTWVGLLFQQAGGTFAAPAYLGPVTGRYIKGLHIADFDGDDRPDLIVVYASSPSGGATRIAVHIQGAVDGEFDPPIDTDASDYFTTSFLADLNGDGFPDVGLARWPGSPGIDRYLHSGVGAGAPLIFGGRIPIANVDFTGQAAGGPLDGDELDDIAALFDGHVSIARQESPGVFGPFQRVP